MSKNQNLKFKQLKAQFENAQLSKRATIMHLSPDALSYMFLESLVQGNFNLFEELKVNRNFNPNFTNSANGKTLMSVAYKDPSGGLLTEIMEKKVLFLKNCSPPSQKPSGPSRIKDIPLKKIPYENNTTLEKKIERITELIESERSIFTQVSNLLNSFNKICLQDNNTLIVEKNAPLESVPLAAETAEADDVLNIYL